jgi:hypothetical protein
MYGYECGKKLKAGNCPSKRCVSPVICPLLKVDHHPHAEVLEKVRKIEGVKKVFVASGLRYDLILEDKAHGDEYLRQVVAHHTSGQMKIAPEHTEERVLQKMGKPSKASLLEFKRRFEKLNRELAAENLPTIQIGIGLHTGVVTVGEMGSKGRSDYTIIGDNVNLAARLQDLSKAYGWSMIISESTQKQITDEFETEFIESVRVKGKSEAVNIYKLLRKKEDM